MIHPDTELRFVSPAIGDGVFATAPIPRGTLVWVLCRLDILLSPTQLAALPPAYGEILDRFCYADADGNTILCWDHGKRLNHSCDPTLLGVGREFEIAVRDIAPGEEITCEYGGLNFLDPMPCACGAANCRGSIRGDDVLRRRLWPDWDDKVAATLPLAAKVAQPLLPFARDPAKFRDWMRGAAPVPSHRELCAAASGTGENGVLAGVPR